MQTQQHLHGWLCCLTAASSSSIALLYRISMFLGNVLSVALHLLKGAVTMRTLQSLVALVHNSRAFVPTSSSTRPITEILHAYHKIWFCAEQTSVENVRIHMRFFLLVLLVLCASHKLLQTL